VKNLRSAREIYEFHGDEDGRGNVLLNLAISIWTGVKSTAHRRKQIRVSDRIETERSDPDGAPRASSDRLRECTC